MKVYLRGYHITGSQDNSTVIFKSFTAYDCDGCRRVYLTSSFYLVQLDDGCYINYFTKDLCKKIQLPSIKIKQISGGNNKIILLTDDGELYKGTYDNIELVPRFLFGQDGKDRIIRIACGSKINVALSLQGKLFNIPAKLEFKNENIKDIVAGREHCVVLDVDGNIFTFGCGSRGQLGHGNLDNELEPKLVEALAGVKISFVAAGGWHSCAVSKDGDLYTWGWNSNGQLGIGEKYSVMASPHVVDSSDYEESINVVKVACGARHTLVLLYDNKLYGCGWNKYRQICDSDQENFHEMVFSYNFEKSNVQDLLCGPWSSAVVVVR